MNIKDQFFIIRNRLFEKRNIIFLIVLTNIFLILFTCLTIIQFCIDNRNELSNSEFNRTYEIYPGDNKSFDDKTIDDIKNIEHIDFVTSNKYESSEMFEAPSFNDGNEKGIILIKALLDDEDVTIKKGQKITNDYEMICSDIFYPHEIDNRIYRNLYLSSKDILNKKATIKSNNKDSENKEVTMDIVGTYQNKIFEESNTCYVNIKTYDEIALNYMGYHESYDEKGNLISRENIEYEDYIIRIDNKKNINKVLQELENRGIQFQKVMVIDSAFFLTLLLIPLFISFIVIIIIIIIIYTFIIKKIKNRERNIGILKSLGYDDRTIITLNINENYTIIFLSCIISIIIYYFVLNNLTYTVLSEVTYYNFILRIPYLLIILSILIFCYISQLFVKKYFIKDTKYNIQELLTK